jgi:hypothetical protein
MLSVDLFIFRYIAIVRPMKLSQYHRRQRLLLIFIFIWLLAIVMALPNLFLLTLHPHHLRLNYHVCGLSDYYIHSYIVLCYKYIESIVFFFIPMLLQVS